MLKTFSIALAGLCALGLGVWVASVWRADSTPVPAAFESMVLLPSPRPIADFALTDQDGRAFTNDRLRGGWSLLFAGFTHCPDVCPTTLGLMKLLEQRLQADRRVLKMVFLSVDPERDTPQRLLQYLRYFSPTLTGATGPADQLERLCAGLGIAYLKNPGATEGEYTLDHTAALVLVNPQGEVAGYLQAPHQLEPMATDLARVVPKST